MAKRTTVGMDMAQMLGDMPDVVEQARALEHLQLVEKMALTNRAVHASMSPEQRREYAGYLVNHRNTLEQNPDPTSSERPAPPEGPAAWAIRQRLAATAGTDPWHAESEFLEMATGEKGKIWQNEALAGKARKLEKLEGDHAAVADDYGKRDEAALLAKKVARQRAELEKLEGMGDLQLTAALLDEGERTNTPEVDRQQSREAVFGDKPVTPVYPDVPIPEGD